MHGFLKLVLSFALIRKVPKFIAILKNKDPSRSSTMLELALINKLLILLSDFPTKTIPLGPEASKLGFDSYVRGRGSPRWCATLGLWRVGEILVRWWTPIVKVKNIFLCSLEISFLMGRMLREIQTLSDHDSPSGQDLFDATLAIYGCLVLSPSVFEFSPNCTLRDSLQAAELPHYSCQKINGGPRMTHEWDSIKIGTLKGQGSGWHPHGTPLEALRWSGYVEVGLYNAVGDYGSADEGPIFLNSRRELGTLYVEDGVAWVPKSFGSLEEILGRQQGNVPYDCCDMKAVDRA
ncbi:hypothetical protein CRG98_037618 [Punica granatum]|uniref:Uncharacterized protein n=1 Tax=Punica granatum TaxID=22663 RepID=A0A2I0IEA6_PUNGR|nr:hypothetical protein CRG98_037618 [Punica granatum]